MKEEGLGQVDQRNDISRLEMEILLRKVSKRRAEQSATRERKAVKCDR